MKCSKERSEKMYYAWKAVAGSRKKPGGVIGQYATREEAYRALDGKAYAGYVQRIYREGGAACRQVRRSRKG